MRSLIELRRLVTSLSLLLALVLSAACAPRRDYIRNTVHTDRTDGYAVKPGQKVAVLTFGGDRHGKAASDLLSIELLRKGVEVIERDSFDRLLAELRRTESGLFNNDMSDAQVIQQLGQVIGVDVIVIGEVHASPPSGTIRLQEVDNGMLLAGAVLIIIPPIGLIVMASATDGSDFGERAPYFQNAAGIVSVRAFNTSNGKVVYWGSAEASLNGNYGDHVGLLDYLRVPIRSLAEGMMDSGSKPKVEFAEGDDIDRVFRR